MICSSHFYASETLTPKKKKDKKKTDIFQHWNTSIGSISLAVEGDLDLEWRWDLLSSSRDGVLDNVKFSTESI